MLVLGVDVGSLSSKAVLWDGEIKGWLIQPTGWSPKKSGREVCDNLLAQLGYTLSQIDCVVGTGYGRVALDFLDKVVTEIACHGQGANYLFPQVRTIIDIGGQDSKVIRINETGKVLDFLMNDKCAAGTGRFLQVAANALELDVQDLSLTSSDQGEATINSMCTVFAESEIIGLLAQGERKERIITGLHSSIAKRIKGMVDRIGLMGKVAFTGGVAKNFALQKVLSERLGEEILVPEEPQIVGALGAAIFAQKNIS